MENWDLRDSTREEQRLSHDALVTQANVGDFFVRASDSNLGCLGLVVKVGPAKVKKFLIQQSKDWTTFTLKGSKKKFSTLSSLLDFFSRQVHKPLPCQLTEPDTLVRKKQPQQQQQPQGLDQSFQSQQFGGQGLPSNGYSQQGGGPMPLYPPPMHMYPQHMPVWELEETPESQAAAEAQIDLMIKRTEATQARIRALEMAIESAQQGGDTADLVATMDALGLPVPPTADTSSLRPELRHADSISAIVEQQQRFGFAAMPPLQEVQHVPEPSQHASTRADKPSKRKGSKQSVRQDSSESESLAQDRARHRKLSKEIEQLLEQRLELERDLAQLSLTRMQEQVQVAKRTHPSIQDVQAAEALESKSRGKSKSRGSRKGSTHDHVREKERHVREREADGMNSDTSAHTKPKQRSKKPNALDAEREELKKERQALERQAYEQRLAFQEEQLAHSRQMLEEERRIRDQERTRLGELLEYEKEMRTGRPGGTLSRTETAGSSREDDRSKEELARLRLLHEQEQTKRRAAEEQVKQERELRERAERYRQLAEDASKRDREERDRLQRQQRDESERRARAEQQYTQARDELESKQYHLEDAVKQAKASAHLQSEAEKRALQAELEQQRSLLKEKEEALERDHRRAIEDAQRREDDLRRQAERAEQARRMAEQALDDHKQAASRVASLQQTESSMRSSPEPALSFGFGDLTPDAVEQAPTSTPPAAARAAVPVRSPAHPQRAPGQATPPSLTIVKRATASTAHTNTSPDAKGGVARSTGAHVAPAPVGVSPDASGCTYLGNCTCERCRLK